MGYPTKQEPVRSYDRGIDMTTSPILDRLRAYKGALLMTSKATNT